MSKAVESWNQARNNQTECDDEYVFTLQKAGDALAAEVDRLEKELDRFTVAKEPSIRHNGISTMRDCPNCKKPIYSITIYCQSCGQRLKWSK